MHIPGYSGILMHNQAYSGIFRTLCNFGIFKTLVYSEHDAYSESCQTSTLGCFVKIVNGYKYFCSISF